MLSIHDVRRNDARVAALELLWLLVQVHVGRHELPLVVRWPVTDYDLGWILVGHHNGWLGQSTSESIWMIRLEWLLEHTGMEVISDLELILRQGSYFWQPLRIQINWLRGPIRKCQAHILPILLQDPAAWGHLSVVEHRCRLGSLGIQLVHRFFQTFSEGSSNLVFLCLLLLKNFLGDCHLNLFFKYLYQQMKNCFQYLWAKRVFFNFQGFWGFGEIGRASCRERVC